jgi:CBS domain-containing protein
MICPRCGHDNFEGTDRCANCIEPLRDRDVPQAKEGFQRLLMEERVSAAGMTTPLIVAPSTTIATVIDLMKRERSGCVLVVDREDLVGIFTERDLILKLVDKNEKIPLEITVGDWMTRSPETVGADESLRVALNKMSIGGFRHIPVVADGRVTGLVTARDALKFVAREALKH